MKKFPLKQIYIVNLALSEDKQNIIFETIVVKKYIQYVNKYILGLCLNWFCLDYTSHLDLYWPLPGRSFKEEALFRDLIVFVDGQQTTGELLPVLALRIVC